MLEKIGLPPKPSLRGNNWVVDASHCQGCSSQFSFINRKHHCRRCGGIFCGSCTQQRMILRGQGDSPVRICDPCKNLEEAARFEARHRHKSKASKGGSASQKEDDVLLNESLGHQKLAAVSSSSSSSSVTQAEGGGSNRNPSMDHASSQVEPESPEKLRERALDEKKKYRVLKDEGKPEEAMRAYKHGKELERQAAALEISLRKNRRKASSSSGIVDDTQDIKDHFKAASEKLNKKSKEKDDLSAELRELGWSDFDLREAEKKAATLTVESELSSLVREVSDKPYKVESTTGTSDRSQVLGHKKKALELKRAGNLSEAKEELKKAKILERKIEEEELLGGADDSDDELSSLIRSMDAEPNKFDSTIDFDHTPGLADDFDAGGNFEVTDEDLEDPDMASALKSLGWVEESVDSQGKVSNQKKTSDTHDLGGSTGGSYAAPKQAPRSKLTIQKELIAIKRKALTLTREGRLDESEHELKKARVLEAELEELNKASTFGQASSETYTDTGDEDDEVTDQDMHDPTYLALLKNMGWEDEHRQDQPSTSRQIAEPAAPGVPNERSTAQSAAAYLAPGRSKKEIQRDLLALKRKALALRRQGETEAADEVLENAKLLEQPSQELEKPTTIQVPTKQMSQVDNLSEEPHLTDKEPEQMAPYKENSGIQQSKLPPQPVDSPPNKSTISQEILVHKRKALALKREGKLTEAKEELRLAKLLERQADEDTRQNTAVAVSNAPDVPSKEKGSPNPPSSRDRFKLQQELLAHKRQALKLRREGKITEAEAELELAKSLESRLQELDSVDSVDSSRGADQVEDFLDPQLLSALESIGFADVGAVSQTKEVHHSEDNNTGVGVETEAENLVERIKSEKLMAVNLKRAGKQAEALSALRRARAYEKKLQSLNAAS